MIDVYGVSLAVHCFRGIEQNGRMLLVGLTLGDKVVEKSCERLIEVCAVASRQVQTSGCVTMLNLLQLLNPVRNRKGSDAVIDAGRFEDVLVRDHGSFDVNFLQNFALIIKM